MPSVIPGQGLARPDPAEAPKAVPASPGTVSGDRRTGFRRHIAILGLAVAAGIAWASLGWLFPLPDQYPGVLPTLRLYAGPEELAVLPGTSGGAQVWLPLAQVPRTVVDAVLVAEDRRFLLHWGIDVLAILRSAATNLKEGRVRQGGSTITQQLARTLFLKTDRTWGRKLRELLIALLLEVRYPKHRILEAYLNAVYMGHDGPVAIHGLAAAAQHFLHKDLARVRLDEAALLAAGINAPNRVFYGDTRRALAARNAILSRMQEQGMVSDAIFREAMTRRVQRSAVRTASRPPIRAPYFVEFAREEIARRVVHPTGEVRIATSLDPGLQEIAEAAIREGIDRVEQRQSRSGRGRVQAALVALEPASGQIRALVGGRQYLDSPFNRATRARRQPGSLFKPIVYLAAFEADRLDGSPEVTPASLIADEPITVRSESGSWSPHNMDRRFRGRVTVRRALEDSLNVPTVRIEQSVGVEPVTRIAKVLGIESPLSPVPSLALGTSEVTLLEMTRAFATLANHGVRVTPTTFAEQPGLDKRFRVAPLPPRVQAVSPESAFLITHLLRGVMRDGTARASTVWGLSEITAGKTGSTDGLRDAWFVGYTPDLVVGVWVGRDDGSPLGLTGAQAALPIWARVMRFAVRRSPPRQFTPPPGIVFASIDRETGRPTSVWCGNGPGIEEAFRAGTEPHADCRVTPETAGVHFFGWIFSLFR